MNTFTSQTCPRQLVICCDGTNNNLTGGSEDTNVVKLAQLFSRSANQSSDLLFYDPGVGNPGELPGATVLDTLGRKSERLAGLAFGRGVYENMAECYLFLMRHYQPGDEIYIFGFSRGAFTARSLSGLINQFGVLQPHMESMLSTLLHVYFSDRDAQPTKMASIAKQISSTFVGSPVRQPDIKFIGVWDTVASVGMWPFGAKITAVPTIQKKKFLNVRQAAALDEHRAQFNPRLYVDNDGTYHTSRGEIATMKQLWFRGSHCDVGGGYAVDQTAISDEALAWLVFEAVQCGLRLGISSPLTSEQDVKEALGLATTSIRVPVVHSELFEQPLWALTGMAVRDTQLVSLDNGNTYRIKPTEHPSVGASRLAFPKDTSWAKPRPKSSLLFCLIMIPLLLLLIGQQLAIQPNVEGILANIDQTAKNVGPLLEQNFSFAHWQLSWWKDLSPMPGLSKYHYPHWAVVWDFALIAAYAYVLAWFAVSGFAKSAGLRRIGDPVDKALNRLGWALPVAVFGDVLENVATLLVIGCRALKWEIIGTVFAIPMSMFAIAKIIGICGVVVLVLGPISQGIRPLK